MANRTLMKDGKWLVPPEERPAGWQKLLDDRPKEAVATPIQPEPPAASAALSDVIAATESAEVKEAQLAEEPVMGEEIRAAVLKSGFAFGADAKTRAAALVMVAGMWTRDPALILGMVGARYSRALRRELPAVMHRYYDAGIWHADDMLVELGVDGKPYGDLQFWLNAMVGTGELKLVRKGRQPAYGSVHAD